VVDLQEKNTSTKTRRNIFIDDSVWKGVGDAAAFETINGGSRVTSSEFIRRAINERLKRMALKRTRQLGPTVVGL